MSVSLCSTLSANPLPSETSGCSSRHVAGLHQRLIRSLNFMGGRIVQASAGVINARLGQCSGMTPERVIRPLRGILVRPMEWVFTH